MATHKLPPLPTVEVLEKVLQEQLSYNPEEGQALASNVCKLLQDSELAMDVIKKYADKVPIPVPIPKAGAIFTGGFLTGYMIAMAMMDLEAN